MSGNVAAQLNAERARAEKWKRRAEKFQAALDHDRLFWQQLGDLLQNGGMYDPSFIIGQVRALLSTRR